MKITKAIFARGVVDEKNMVQDTLPQVAFIGRSNVGKSSVINSLVNNKKLARSSSTPGRTQEINLFLIQESFYFVDLPGYGYARGSFVERDTILSRIYWYLFESGISQYKIVLIIDSRIGMTESDQTIFNDLKNAGKDVVVVFNKIDKLNQSELQKNIRQVKEFVGDTPLIMYSSVKKIGIEELTSNIYPN